ncbi:hypothetical protein OQZ33_17290 [Pedobacter sp. MC2016-05]|uniref:hypothetical protein n=1 Tax=Pedobacter sp. MC2016-05 TaxID=2994474 RepID=UPI00224811E6|nr:hypothetical protein [Pedobacter sp. MC2016-05]MCX2476092.1 hypothetical protein [Pedobacter sp. MC2016-05]
MVSKIAKAKRRKKKTFTFLSEDLYNINPPITPKPAIASISEDIKALESEFYANNLADIYIYKGNHTMIKIDYYKNYFKPEIREH